jgi:Lar family restriction alleviation protein
MELPCPFCGCFDLEVGYYGQPSVKWYIRCRTCGTRGPTVNDASASGGAGPAIDLVELWNRRAATK